MGRGERRRSPRLGPARRSRCEGGRDRQRSRPTGPRSGRQVARYLERSQPLSPCTRPARARHLRRLACHRLGLERCRDLRLQRRREAPRHPGHRRRRLHHRRRRGRGNRLRGQARREDHQPLDRRHRDLGDRAARHPLGRSPQRPDRRLGGQRARGRQPGRVPGGVASAARLARPRRHRAFRGSDRHGRDARVLLEHGLVHLPLSAPGFNVFSAISGYSDWPRAELPWQSPGYYGWASGTSFAAPLVAGAAALVWGANPALPARQVAWILKQSASSETWSPQLGWGRLDVGAAVALAAQAKPWERRAIFRLHRRG